MLLCVQKCPKTVKILAVKGLRKCVKMSILTTGKIGVNELKIATPYSVPPAAIRKIG